MSITFSSAVLGLAGTDDGNTISPQFRSIFLKITAHLELEANERNFLASPAEALMLLSWRRGKPLSAAYLRKLKQLKRLRAATEYPTRYQIHSLLEVTFDPPGPKPRSRHNG